MRRRDLAKRGRDRGRRVNLPAIAAMDRLLPCYPRLFGDRWQTVAFYSDKHNIFVADDLRAEIVRPGVRDTFLITR